MILILLFFSCISILYAFQFKSSQISARRMLSYDSKENKYLEEANQFTKNETDKALLALRFLSNQKDKDIEILQLETKYLQREALLKSQLSAISLRLLSDVFLFFLPMIYSYKSIYFIRYVLERFLNEVIREIHNNFKIIKLLQNEHPTEFKNLFKLDSSNKTDIPIPIANPKMTHVNNALYIENVQKVIWEKLGISLDVKLPGFPNDILYGKISDIVHLPKFRAVLVSDKSDTDFKVFFSYIVKRYDLIIDEYSEEAAAAAADKESEK